MTKAQKTMVENYKRATATDLWQVYGTFSESKSRAMDYCKELQYQMNGFGGRICSANTFQFTYAFQYIDADGDSCLCYITKAHNKMFKLGLE